MEVNDFTKIAVIGAGMAGITVARRMSSMAEVTVFEKSRGIGGRMTTRRAGDYAFDHGAQFYTARSAGFTALIEQAGADVIQPWQPKLITLEQGRKPFKRQWFEPHYVGLPGMNSVLKQWATGFTVHTGTRVNRIQKCRQGYRLLDESEHSLGDFDWVICSAPAPQTLDLLPQYCSFRESIDAVEFEPCFALMLGFAQLPAIHFDAAVVRNEPIAWIGVNNSKPGRKPASSLLIHSDNHWATEHLDESEHDISEALSASLAAITDVDSNVAEYRSLHRWRYAKVATPLSDAFLIDTENRLAACGDWCSGNRVEDAFLSGEALATSLTLSLQ